MKSVRLVAKGLWIIPVLLLGLMAHQIGVARNVAKTLETGEKVMARVVTFDIKEMVAQTHGILELEVPRAGELPFIKTLTVPASWMYKMGTSDSLAVYTLEGGGQEVVIENLARVQARTAWINAAVALLFVLITAIPIFLWGRILSRDGDPAYRPPADTDELIGAA